MTSQAEPLAALQVFDQRRIHGLRVEFYRLGKTYDHRIVGIGAEGVMATLLESVGGECSPSPLRGEVRRGVESPGGSDPPLTPPCEGGGFYSWPASPVLQELNTQGQTAMLIGNAGDGHWSLAMGPLAGESATGLLFDVACRVKSLPSYLTSTYRVAQGVHTSSTDGVLKLGTQAGEWLLESVAVDAGLDPCQLSLKGSLLEFRHEPLGPVPATFRWQYALRLPG